MNTYIWDDRADTRRETIFEPTDRVGEDVCTAFAPRPEASFLFSCPTHAMGTTSFESSTSELSGSLSLSLADVQVQINPIKIPVKLVKSQVSSSAALPKVILVC